MRTSASSASPIFRPSPTYFLICTATSSTHVKTLCDAVEEAMDEAGEPMLSREGHRGGTWVLMDFGSLVVHVFTARGQKVL